MTQVNQESKRQPKRQPIGLPSLSRPIVLKHTRARANRPEPTPGQLAQAWSFMRPAVCRVTVKGTKE